MQVNYSNFSFDSANGLFYDDQLIADFNLCVKKKETILDAAKNSKTKHYLVEASYIDGRDKVYKWVDNLKNLDLFDLYEINDCFLKNDNRKLILSKLMHEASKVPNKVKINTHNGLQMLNEYAVYVLGEHVICQNNNSEKIDFITHSRLQPIKYTDKEEMLKLCNSYINLLPGVTDILFFGSLFAAVKPFVEHVNISCGLVLSLVAPAGHLKTTLARKYALWLINREEQEIGIYARNRDSFILDMIDKQSGQNILIDDLRKIQDNNEAKRQEKRLDIISRQVNAKNGCANVIFTGETMEKMGMFSCIDRIFQIRMPKMDAKEIETLKKKVSSLAPELMPSIVLLFVHSLMEHSEEVLHDIQNYYEKNSINQDADGTATRIHRHALFIRLTAYLFAKYVFCKEIVVNTYEHSLTSALTEQMRIQQVELEKIRLSEETPDYIIELYEILNAENKYIRLCSNPTRYNANDGNSCLLYNEKIYITGKSLKNALFNRYERYIPQKQVLDSLAQEGILEMEPGSKGRQKNYMDKKHYVILMRFFVNYLHRHDYPVPKDTYKKYLIEK